MNHKTEKGKRTGKAIAKEIKGTLRNLLDSNRALFIKTKVKRSGKHEKTAIFDSSGNVYADLYAIRLREYRQSGRILLSTGILLSAGILLDTGILLSAGIVREFVSFSS